MPNIIEKVSKSGAVTYQAVVRVDVKRPIKRTFSTYAEAEAWRAATDAAERAKLEEAKEPAYDFKLREVLEDYEVNNPGANTGALIKALFDFLEQSLSSLNAHDLENLDNPSLDLAESVIEHGRKYFGCAVSENPVANLKARRENLPFRPITAYEEDLLIEGAAHKANGNLRDLIILAFDTGLTQHEILKLERKHVDLKHGVIRFTSECAIPLTDRAKEVLKERLKSDTVELFPGARQNTLQTAFIRLRDSLGINGPDFNDIRQIAMIRLSEKMSLQELKDALGYSRWESLGWLIVLQRSRKA